MAEYDNTPAPVDTTSRGVADHGGEKTEDAAPEHVFSTEAFTEELSTACEEKDEHLHAAGVEDSVESTDRGLFGFGGKKKEDDALNSEFEQKAQVSEVEPKKESLLHKLHRSDSSSSSSSDEEEVEEGGVKKKKLKEKIKDKVKGTDKKTDEVAHHEEDNSIPVEKYSEVPKPEEKKGFMEKIKEKLPGNKKTDEVAPAPAAAVAPPPVVAAEPVTPTEEKKGFVEKIKEKLPGFHSKTEEEKEKEKNQY